MKNIKTIVCDLDDTLANHEIRNRLYHRSGGHFDILFSPELVVFDTVNERVKLILDVFMELDYKVFILSARPETMLEATKEWLEVNNIKYTNIQLKQTRNQFMKSAQWKTETLKLFKMEFPNVEFSFAIDDWKPVIDAFEEEGIKVFDAKKINTI